MVREGVTEKEERTNNLKEGRKHATQISQISGKKAAKSKQKMQIPQVGTCVACWHYLRKASMPATQ